jgi:hypothetical protein
LQHQSKTNNINCTEESNLVSPSRDTVQLLHPSWNLLATEPARDTALSLGGTLFDLRVELVDGFEGLCASVLAESLDVALCAASLPVGLGDLWRI